jgi:hypothetical protein
VDGFPFHAPSISEFDIGTITEKTSNGKTEHFSNMQALHDSPAQDVYSFNLSLYYEEEDDSTEIYADFVHRSLVTKMVDGTQPISQGCKRWAFLVPLHVLSAYGYQSL